MGVRKNQENIPLRCSFVFFPPSRKKARGRPVQRSDSVESDEDEMPNLLRSISSDHEDEVRDEALDIDSGGCSLLWPIFFLRYFLLFLFYFSNIVFCFCFCLSSHCSDFSLLEAALFFPLIFLFNLFYCLLSCKPYFPPFRLPLKLSPPPVLSFFPFLTLSSPSFLHHTLCAPPPIASVVLPHQRTREDASAAP